MTRTETLTVCVMVILFTIIPLEAALQYMIVDLRTFGGSSNYAGAINDSGWIVGKTYPSSFLSAEAAVIWKDGTMFEIGGANTSATGINNAGQVIVNKHNGGWFIWENGVKIFESAVGEVRAINNRGQVAGVGSNSHAILWDNGVLIDLGPSYDKSRSYAWGINDNGWVVGWSTFANQGGRFPCYWVPGGPIKINAGGTAADINNEGQIVGSRQSSWGLQAYLWESGIVTELGNFGGDSFAYAINDHSQVVGHAVGTNSAYIWEEGTMTSLKSLIPDDSGWTPRYAWDINNNGQIIGDGYYQGGIRSFLMTPMGQCIDDLAARAKSGKVQLTWSDTGHDHYNVYHSTVTDGPYTFIASTTSTYSTYLDEGLMNGTTYYYIVRAATANDDELCQSNEASATPTARVRRR